MSWCVFGESHCVTEEWVPGKGIDSNTGPRQPTEMTSVRTIFGYMTLAFHMERFQTLFMSAASTVPSQVRIDKDKTCVLYTRILVGRAIATNWVVAGLTLPTIWERRVALSDWRPPSENWVLPRYTKLSTCCAMYNNILWYHTAILYTRAGVLEFSLRPEDA